MKNIVFSEPTFNKEGSLFYRNKTDLFEEIGKSVRMLGERLEWWGYLKP